jgi:hypothetical protein
MTAKRSKNSSTLKHTRSDGPSEPPAAEVSYKLKLSDFTEMTDDELTALYDASLSTGIRDGYGLPPDATNPPERLN